MRSILRVIYFLVFACVAAQAQVTFSPIAGTYSGPITLTMSAPAGYTIFYTTNGYPATMASKQYISPITVSASMTINAIAGIVQNSNQDVQLTSAHWKICTPNGGTAGGTSPSSSACKGVTGQPTSWSWSFGTTALQLMTSPVGTGSQILNIFSGPSSNASTGMTQHKVVQATIDDTCLENNESDMQMVDTLHTRVVSCGSPAKVQTCDIGNNGGLQCEQAGAGHPGHWCIAGNASWVCTTVTQSCPWPANTTITFDYQIHWDFNDTSCSGLPCDNYDFLQVNGTRYSLAAWSPIPSRPLISGGYLGNQDQLDNLKIGCISGRRIMEDNVTGFTYNASPPTGTATYTIGSGPAVNGFPGILR